MLARFARLSFLSFVCVSTAILTAAATARSLGAQVKLVFVPIRVSEVMSPADQHRTGVDHLTPEQRFALDAWLTRYTAELRAPEPPDDHRAIAAETDGSDAVPLPGGQRQPRVAPVTAPPGARLISTPDEGTYVRLADGTLWEVYLPDRTTTVTWRRGDYVVVSRAASSSGDYDYVLADASARARALARFVDVVAPRR
jgi:hypothetical protein